MSCEIDRRDTQADLARRKSLAQRRGNRQAAMMNAIRRVLKQMERG